MEKLDRPRSSGLGRRRRSVNARLRLAQINDIRSNSASILSGYKLSSYIRRICPTDGGDM